MNAARSLQHIPKAPHVAFLGSIPHILRNGGFNRLHGILVSLYQEHGSFFEVPLPGGNGMLVTSDPIEFTKVLQKDSKNPYGGAQEVWPFAVWNKRNGCKYARAITSEGQEWQNFRSKLQPVIFNKNTVLGYEPIVKEIVSRASPLVEMHVKDIPIFLDRVAFDLFCSIIIDYDPRSIDGSHLDNIYDLKDSIRLAGELTRQPFLQSLPLSWIPMWRQFDTVQHRVNDFLADLYHKQLAEPEKLGKCFLKDLLSSDKFSDNECIEYTVGMIQAGVDSTSIYNANILLQLALNPDKQDILAQELRSGNEDSTYFKAVVRESNRISPIGLFTVKKLREPMEIHGYDIPAGRKIMFFQEGALSDPNLVDNPDKFFPERWIEKSGVTETITHPLFDGPFGKGTRMCLGKRIAQLETKWIISQFIRDWKFEVAPGQKWERLLDSFISPDVYPNLLVTPR